MKKSRYSRYAQRFWVFHLANPLGRSLYASRLRLELSKNCYPGSYASRLPLGVASRGMESQRIIANSQ